ncbi:MAG: EVE domain-containing protein [Dongiaceae bacterium]
MAFWLVKSEPSSYSWEQMVKDGRTFWSGVRNFQASSNLKKMKAGDRAFFYHSGDDKAVVGIVEVVREYYPDHTDETGKFGMVDVKAVAPVKTHVTLAAIKAETKLKNLLLVKQSRLSVVPIDEPSWRLICSMGGVKS